MKQEGIMEAVAKFFVFGVLTGVGFEALKKNRMVSCEQGELIDAKVREILKTKDSVLGEKPGYLCAVLDRLIEEGAQHFNEEIETLEKMLEDEGEQA